MHTVWVILLMIHTAGDVDPRGFVVYLSEIKNKLDAREDPTSQVLEDLEVWRLIQTLIQ